MILVRVFPSLTKTNYDAGVGTTSLTVNYIGLIYKQITQELEYTSDKRQTSVIIYYKN